MLFDRKDRYMPPAWNANDSVSHVRMTFVNSGVVVDNVSGREGEDLFGARTDMTHQQRASLYPRTTISKRRSYGGRQEVDARGI